MTSAFVNEVYALPLWARFGLGILVLLPAVLFWIYVKYFERKYEQKT
jgi:hypothetical protein